MGLRGDKSYGEIAAGALAEATGVGSALNAPCDLLEVESERGVDG
jgi:hypothetical protein